MTTRRVLLLLVLIPALHACEQSPIEASANLDPRTRSAEAIGYYCRMGLEEHSGPQAQMFVAGAADPIWFAQVRDAVVYLRSPEELRKAKEVYVNDMAVAKSWDEPGVDNWIDLDSAVLVIESRRTGGMQAPEVIPFGTEAAARAFIGEYGGRVVSLSEIPDSYVLSPMAM